ncbi:hypothetical protein O0I10_005035 [Lichtheimia ornata]|uniref:Uncharacterized protein n=1 Tax=Lichtheimia ornata TaxID=688661 RepID=A0AAD7V5Q8_9FUNG|nr:uncharacterized protein O0I10_005035 [Lichtheimia ornata]KAJ8659320.1 hypothetical protein O0I10_005035 [Lichtheimia ornata]
MTVSTPSRRIDSTTTNLDFTPPRTEPPRTPSFLRSSSRRRNHITTPSPTFDPHLLTPSRRLAPDLRGSLLRRHHTTQVDSFSPHRDDTIGHDSDIFSPLRRTQSSVDPNRPKQQQQPSSSLAMEEQRQYPWTHADWIRLSSYYENLGRDMKKTVNVFYRHESLQTSPSNNGSQEIEEKWSEEFIRYRVYCLDVVRRRHNDSLENRVQAYETRKRKRDQSSLDSATNTSKNIINNLGDNEEEENEDNEQLLSTPKRRRTTRNEDESQPSSSSVRTPRRRKAAASTSAQQRV